MARDNPCAGAPVDLVDAVDLEVEGLGQQHEVQFAAMDRNLRIVVAAGDAARLVGWYALRWRIEDFHRVLKTGCRVESRQVRAAEKLKAFIALDMVVAVHLLSLVWQARISPELPVEGWLERDEWEVLAAHAAGGGPPPERPAATGEAVRMIARLGGFLGRKGDGDPGPEVLWRGLAKLRTLVEAWRAFKTKRCG